MADIITLSLPAPNIVQSAQYRAGSPITHLPQDGPRAENTLIVPTSHTRSAIENAARTLPQQIISAAIVRRGTILSIDRTARARVRIFDLDAPTQGIIITRI